MKRSLSGLIIFLLFVGAFALNAGRVCASSQLLSQQFFAPTLPLNQMLGGTAPSPTPESTTLEKFVLENQSKAAPLVGFMRTLIVNSLQKGLSGELLALLLLLPLVASLVAFSRHVIGLTGFSIYAPTGLAIVFLSTGILPGIALFSVMLAVSALGKKLISYLKLEYVPRTAMLLWAVSLGLFSTVILSGFVPQLSILRVEVLPLLLLVLLVEDFMAPQSGLKWRLVLDRSLQILFLAVVGSLLIGNLRVQEFALLNPEIIIIGVAIANFLTGRYLGLRLTEYFRFRPLMDAEE